ncbi:S-layer homology domain-containing protein [Cohnella nanjingensis]|uniref:S-layer homology domain-containing protein n=1 Tax=Cohnella nanjingensis TaxID=1387779 RepID=A0A7X0RRS0_9BACL|nr:S-layer homology domain-containing protein [Cohnella nanjingensis]MBB6672268.1 S-layer homology domain-containing protein [Cohnella nanjingensis]
MRKLTIAYTVTIALAALSCTGAAASAADYKDVPDTSPYLSHIDNLKSLGVTEGIAEGIFGPEQTLTRAQFAKLVSVAFQLKDNGGSVPFSDIQDHWAAAYIRAVFQSGIVSGTSSTTFSPNKPVKREEASVMVWRYAKKMGLSPGTLLNFSEKPDPWATEGISSIIAHEWYGEDVKQNSDIWSYRPQAAMTRQESAALIDLAMKDIPGSLSAPATPAPAAPAPATPAPTAPAPTAPAPATPAPAAPAPTAPAPATPAPATPAPATPAPATPAPATPAPATPAPATPAPTTPAPTIPANGVRAGLASGSVPYGSMVILSASKPGATIYYTTDGSDPRTSPTRKHYISPIKVLSKLQLKTSAVYHPAAGKTEVSDVSTYRYETIGTPPAPSVGLYDSFEDFKQVSDRTNVYIATDHPAYFADDTNRLARTSTESGSVIYQTDYDITSLLIYSYFFTGIDLEKNRLFASADGKEYKEVPVSFYPVGYPTGNWQQYANEASSLPPHTRFLKIELRGAAKSWSPQLSSVLLNRNTASVAIKSTRSAGSLQVELSSASQGARIYYRKDNALAFQPYSEPLKLTGYSVLETYAVKDGKEPSPLRKYKLNGSSDILVDSFGQMVSANFPEKVTDEQELKADALSDASYYDGLKPPANLDRYGGLAGSSAKYGLKGTGFFAIQQLGGRKVMKTPEGNVFFSLGMNGISAHETYTMVKGREQQFESIPPYEGQYQPAFITSDHGSFSFYMANKYRKTGEFPTESSFYTEAVGRLKKWGFNSAGGYSPEKYGSLNNFPYVRMLPLNMDWAKLDGISIFDIFAPDAEAKIDQAFANALPQNKDDRMLIGYFIGNEYDFHKFYSDVPKLKASSAAIKGRFVKMLKDKYQNIDTYNSNWGTSFTSFNDLREAELPIKTSQSWKDMDMFFRYYLDTFYGTVSRIYRKYDPNHLLLGDRWITTSFHNEKIRDVMAEVEGKYSDVISINYYSYKIESDFLKDVYTKSGGKPILLSEFGYGTAEQGLNPLLPNAAVNQFQRGMRYRNYVEGVADLGYIVGAHWFNYVDQAPLGRYWQGIGSWAERYNSGVLNVADRPYKSFLAGVMQSNYDIYKVLLGERPNFYYDFSQQK